LLINGASLGQAHTRFANLQTGLKRTARRAAGLFPSDLVEFAALYW
jgi:hypothetical protein